MKKILLFGTFDGVHEGHRVLFAQAKKLGDEVMVVVARDETVGQVKKRLPNNSEDKRLEDVLQQDDVSQARLGVTDGDKYAVIGEYAPDIILLGYDQKVFTENLETVIAGYGLDTKIKRASAYMPEKYKSSLINTYLS